MIYVQKQMGSVIKTTFISGPESPRRVVFVVDGAIVALPSNVVGLEDSIFSVEFSPTSTGTYDVIVDNEVVARYEVVYRDVISLLGSIEDSCLGGWEWNKTSGVMTLYRQNGEELATFSCGDSLEEAFQRPA